MSETVTITPAGGRDDDGNPIANGRPFEATALVEPGNTNVQFTGSGNVDTVDFTLYMRFGVNVNDGDLITVRGRDCLARVRDWRTSPTARRGGVVVLCSSVTGAS